MSHGNEMRCQPLTLSGYAESLKVADAVIEAPLGLEAKGASGLSDQFYAPRPPSHGARPDSGLGRGTRRAGAPRLRPRLRLPRRVHSPTSNARHALCSLILFEGFHGDGDRSACGRGKNRARLSRTHVPSRLCPQRSGGDSDPDDARSSHPPQRITAA